jgi:hypothetical protein
MTAPQDPAALAAVLRVVAALDDLQVPYHLGGSYASSIHGIPRQTHDVDLIVDLPLAKVASLIERLEGEFYADAESGREAVRRRASFNLLHLDTGIKVDLFIKGTEAFDDEEFSHRQAMPLTGDALPMVWVKSPEDTLIRKLLWYRMGGGVSDRQWQDIRGIVAVQDDRLDRDYLRRWAARLGIDDLLDRALRPPNGL